MTLSQVSNVLWRERQLLELLLFKLEEEQLLLAAGRTRWLPFATREIEHVIEQIKETELARAVAVEAIGLELGLGPNPSLKRLAEVAPSPWGGMLEEHRRAFLGATQEIVGMAESNRDLLSKGWQAARQVLASFGEIRIDTYSAAGTAAEFSSGPRLVDEAL